MIFKKIDYSIYENEQERWRYTHRKIGNTHHIDLVKINDTWDIEYRHLRYDKPQQIKHFIESFETTEKEAKLFINAKFDKK